MTDAYLSPQLAEVLDTAQKEATAMQDDYVSAEHVLDRHDVQTGPVLRFLKKNGVTRDDILKV